MTRSAGFRKAAWYRPILSNIYLHKLDEFVEKELIPQYTRGEQPETRTRNTRGWRSGCRTRGGAGTGQQARDLARQMRALPSGDPMDPGYRRLCYSRYADDHLLGFIGPKAEAEQIKAELAGSCGRPSPWNSTRTRP